MIRWEVRGDVGVATIDRPERRNALDAAHCAALVDHLGAHATCRAVVLTGAGGTFCAGADLGNRFGGEPGPQDEDAFRPAFEAALAAVVDFPAPVLAAMVGPVLGAGLQLAVACDLRIAAPDASLGIPAGRLGVHLSAPNVARIAQVAGQGVARDLLLGSRVLSGDEAHACGLSQRVADDPLAAALAWAGDIAELAPLSISGHKRALNLVADGPYDPEGLAEVDELEQRAFASEDLREGIAAFTEKRTPRFRGR